MNRHYISLILGTAVLVFLQAIVLNHLRVFEYYLPILYLYPILKMPLNSPKWFILLFAALTGFCVDLLMNTPGLNLAATALSIYFREPVLIWLISEETREDTEGVLIPGASNMKVGPYLLYLLFITTVHISTLLLLESFSLGLFNSIVPYILGGIGFTVTVYLLFDLFTIHKKVS